MIEVSFPKRSTFERLENSHVMTLLPIVTSADSAKLTHRCHSYTPTTNFKLFWGISSRKLSNETVQEVLKLPSGEIFRWNLNEPGWRSQIKENCFSTSPGEVGRRDESGHYREYLIMGDTPLAVDIAYWVLVA